jgi:catechol 2,3-dioxygenase
MLPFHHPTRLGSNQPPLLSQRGRAEHPAPTDAVRPERGQVGLVHIAFKVDSYAGLRDAYAHLLGNGLGLQRAVDHVCQRSIYFTDPDGNGLEIYYEMRDALTLTDLRRFLDASVGLISAT